MSEQPISTPALSLTLAPNLLAFFREELDRALRQLELSSSDETLAYLVHLLEGYARPDTTQRHEVGFARPAALMLSDAVFGSPGERVEAYRRLGDACLYNCGFFTAHLTRRSVSASYYRSMGRDAYERVSDMMRGDMSALRAIFAELSQKFEGFVEALRTLARQHKPHEALMARLRRGEHVSVEELERAGLLIGARADATRS